MGADAQRRLLVCSALSGFFAVRLILIIETVQQIFGSELLEFFVIRRTEFDLLRWVAPCIAQVFPENDSNRVNRFMPTETFVQQF